MSNYTRQKFGLGTVWDRSGDDPLWPSFRTSRGVGKLRLCC